MSECIVEGVDHGLHRDPQPPCCFPIDLHLHAETVVLRFRRDVLQKRRGLHPLRQFCPPDADLIGICTAERVLKLRPAHAGRNLDVLHRLEIHDRTGHGCDCLLQSPDDLGDRHLALITRSQRDRQPGRIWCRIDRRDADDRHDSGDIGILADGALHRGLQPLHLAERDLLPAFHDRENEARVLQRQEPLGNDDVEPDRRNERGAGHDERQRLVAQHPVQAAPVEFDRAIDRAVKYPRDAGARGVRPLMPQ